MHQICTANATPDAMKPCTMTSINYYKHIHHKIYYCAKTIGHA
uniref:Uncharacterized protein n=1 Tax=Arundo donax TaxID=35708 RepID=A0A0A8ZC78_ARUDO